MENRNSTFLTFVTDYVSVGYLYLILLGIASDSIFYGLLGVNIITYSGVLDVLLSPVAYLTKSIFYSVFIILLFPFSYYYLRFLRSKAVGKESYLTAFPLSSLWIAFIAFMIFMYYVGLGIGGGLSHRKRLMQNSFRLDHTITFTDNEVQPVKLIGNNSGYVFYVEKGQKTVSISPIANVKKIQFINSQ